MNNLQIICDSLADIPKNTIEKYSIEVIPLTIRIDETDYKDGVNISNEEFYKKLKETKDMPKTSQATYGQFEQTFKRYINEGKEILYISGSSKVTGTYQSAMMAKNELKGKITLFDSLNLSYGCGVQVVKACELAKQGCTVENIVKKLEKMRENVHVFFAVDTLEYLKKGGRISNTKAAVGSMLNIKPILEVKDGELTNVAKVRGKKHVIEKLRELAKSRCNVDSTNRSIAIGEGSNREDLKKLEVAVQNEFGIDSMVKIEIGPSIGSHAGPGTIGICLY
ncbi:DegV family protein [Romboutsia sp.]|uniref:DegV family protein n=1 Tax=Romboutsia sp. TaxID=1965302 RepID=UPI003F3697F7